MPHERAVRAWLSRAGLAREDIEDVIQESYCRFAGLANVDHIEKPDAYFFQTARSLVIRRAARQKIVPFVPIVDENHRDDNPTPERAAGARLELQRVLALLEQLPERRRQIFSLKRIEGLSQREIATRMNVSENVVEHEIALGLADLKRAWTVANGEISEALAVQPKVKRA